MTPYRLLLDLCGLSAQEAADFHKVRLDTVKSWAAGRNKTPSGVVDEIRDLIDLQIEAAEKLLLTIKGEVSRLPDGETLTVELALASDDHEARHPPLGWPSRSAQAMMLARVLAKLPENVSAVIVPRGAAPASAKAADVHDKA